MVRAHPEIFTAFYDIKGVDVPKPLLRRVYLLMSRLPYFPDTLALLWKEERTRLLEALLSQAPQLHIEAGGEELFRQDDMAHVTGIYDFLRERVLPLLGAGKRTRELLRYEYIVNQMPLRPQPLIETFLYDVLKISAGIRHNDFSAGAERLSTTVLFVANGEAVDTSELARDKYSRLRIFIAQLFFKSCAIFNLFTRSKKISHTGEPG